MYPLQKNGCEAVASLHCVFGSLQFTIATQACNAAVLTCCAAALRGGQGKQIALKKKKKFLFIYPTIV